jgi:uncharacterized membrane protein YjfL (UPF0719 family)
VSGDEVFALVVSSIIALVIWGRWYYFLMGRPSAGATLLAVLPPLCAVGLYAVLRLGGSHDVRNDPKYLAMYVVMGAAWVGVARALFAVMGLNVWEDVINRRNPAAMWVTLGGIIGFSECFAGANIGEGPSWTVVVFSAALSSAGLFVAWAIIQSVNPTVDNITIDRDRATGLRLGAVLIAVGLIMGRAVAGNWVSASATVGDFFRFTWPVIPFILCEIFLDQMLRPSPENPVPNVLSAGVFPALVYIAASLFALVALAQPT